MKAIILALSLFTCISVQASSLVVGDSVNAISLQDQHDKVLSVTDKTRVVLFSRGMKGGDIIKGALESLPEEQRSKELVYVADISGMPSLIAKFVAVPQMQDLPFNIALDREGEPTKLWPGDKETATVIHLQQLKIINVTRVETSDALLEAIK
ncbi:hypothetical protein K0I73_02335 [Shewanella mesophila]|uniref:hypothetical protein n=1 Tax=Shewanella mesophila TaxID=2864208 RepID=UPI001C65EB22|nr:hypothetical protein [Shewanella mesophila]QYJ86613.1 hypothetical protein K0I73_02335 [Shewanella mesophila]